MIRLYCVGIHFRKLITFSADLPGGFMSGNAILAVAGKLGLRYRLTVPPAAIVGHIAYVGFTPTTPLGPHDLPYRITDGGPFPFFGQPLSLTEVLAPIGQPSLVLQYTVTPIIPIPGYDKTPPPEIPFPVKTLNHTGDPTDPTKPLTTGSAQFGPNGFPDNCEIRVRGLSIYCTT